MSESYSLKVTGLPVPKLAFTNRVYVSKACFDKIVADSNNKLNPSDPTINISIGGKDLVFLASPLSAGLSDNEIAMNSQQRKCGNFTLQQELKAAVFTPDASVALHSITINCDLFVKKAGQKLQLDVAELSQCFKVQFSSQVFCARQQLAVDFNGTKLDCSIDSFEHVSLGDAPASKKGEPQRGQVLSVTSIVWKKAPGSQTNIVFEGVVASEARNDSLFQNDFNFEKMGIGGLDEQFRTMFRTAFASRIYPGVMKQMGINHVRGMLLYGPPGCGKTLIARQIGKILNAREPKIINGPEVLDKFVGGSEEKVRALFEDAEKEQAEMGDSSMLHTIIFDEMDAIMKTRGSTSDSTGVSDSVVNQLLSKIDGVDSLNNILIIGMTNRKDMIDEAILRPGRLEIHIEIGLPNEVGREQILNIKTMEMRKHDRVTKDVLERLPELAHRTKNYTGAELEGLVRSAASFALNRNVNAATLKVADIANVRVEWNDFENALLETTPAFGNKDNEELRSHFSNGICHYGPAFDDLWATLQRLTNQTRQSKRTPLLSVLLEGTVSSGKTAIAAKLAATSDFPFVRMISADSMIGKSERARCDILLKVFMDSYKSPQSIIFIDDIERIIEYSPVGHRFSNSVLQTLLVLLRKVPPAPARLLVVATTSIAHLLNDLHLTTAFNVTLHVSLLQTTDEYCALLREYGAGAFGSSGVEEDGVIARIAAGLTKPIAVKQLLMVLEMARAEAEDADTNDDSGRQPGLITSEQFLACLFTVTF